MRSGPITALGAVLISALVLLPRAISAADSATANGQALLQALREADRPLAMALIKKRTDVNSRDETGATPLMWAAQRADLELVGRLLQAGADPNIHADNGLGPLQVAIANQASDIALLLLAHGAKANVAREGGETPLMTAARTGQLKVMEQLIAKGADVNAHEDKFHQTALMWSAGHPEQVKLLIKHGAQVRARTKVWQVTNTIYQDPAAGFAWEAVGEYVSRKGGQNALFFTVRKDDIESAKALLAAGVDVNDRAADGSTALLLALYKWETQRWQGPTTLRPHFKPNVHTANLLLDHGAEVNVADATGVTPLHGAVLSLVPQAPTDMQLTTTEDPPPPAKLVVDPEEGLQLVRRMLDMKANPHAVTRYAGEEPSDGILLDRTPPRSSPLHIAALTGNVELVKLLLARGSDPTLRDQTGHDPLSIAVKANDLPLVTLLASGQDDLKRVYQPVDAFRELPADPGADISGAPAGPRANQTILHIAAAAGADKVIAFLVERGAPLNARNDRGETPLDLADAQERVRFAAAKSYQERKKIESGIDSPDPVRQTHTSEAIKRLMRTKTATVRAP